MSVEDPDGLIRWGRRGYPEPIARISRRIAPGWWNRIETSRGWWPLLARLDASLAEIDHAYTLNGVASKEGVLRYLATSSTESIRFDDVLWAGMLEASRTCEVCGELGARAVRGEGRAEVLCDVHARPLSDAEASALLASGVPQRVFSEEGARIGAEHKALSDAFIDAIARTHMTESEVAAQMRTNVDTVRRLFREGELAGAERDGRVAYPRWQLTVEGHPLPSLRRVLARFPDRYTWFEVRAAMLRPEEEFGDLSPKQWLERGMPISPVTALLLGLNYE